MTIFFRRKLYGFSAAAELINPLRPSNAYIYICITGPSLVQIVACRLFDKVIMLSNAGIVLVNWILVNKFQ